MLLAFADGPPQWDRWPVYVAALAAQFGADLAITALREWRAVASWPRRLLTAAGIAYGVDAALAPLGLLAAFASTRMHSAFLLVLPLAVVLTVFAGERGRRITRRSSSADANRAPACCSATSSRPTTPTRASTAGTSSCSSSPVSDGSA